MRKARAKASKLSSSSESYESDPEKAYMRKEKKEKDEGENPEKQAEKKEEEAKEQEEANDPKEQEAAKDPKDQEEAKDPEEQEVAKDPEEQEKAEADLADQMSMADAVKSIFKMDDSYMEMMIEPERKDAVKEVLSELERPIDQWPESYGLKLEKMCADFKSWSGELEDVVHKTYDEIEQKNAEIDYAQNKLDEALEMKAAAEAEIEEKTAESERLDDGLQTAKGALDASTEVCNMLQEVVSQSKAAVSSDEMLRKRLFAAPATPAKRNPQLEMLQALMEKRRTGTATPASAVSVSESEGPEKKVVRGSDRPSEPKEPPKQKPRPEAKAAPDILKKEAEMDEKKDKRDAERVEKSEKRDVKQPKERWLLPEAMPTRQRTAPGMWRMAKERGAKIPPSDVRKDGKAELFCQICWDEQKGWTLWDPSAKRRNQFYGFGAHTYQKCYSFIKLNDRQKQVYIDEANKAITGALNPDPKWGSEPVLKKRKVDPKVIAVEDDDERKRKGDDEGKEKKKEKKPNIFTAEVPQADKDKKVEAKKTPKKDPNEKKEKKEKKAEKAKKDENRPTADITDME